MSQKDDTAEELPRRLCSRRQQKGAGTHLLHIIRDIFESLKIEVLQRQQGGQVPGTSGPQLLRCKTSHEQVVRPGRDKTGRDGGTRVNCSRTQLFNFVRSTGSLTQRAESADAQTSTPQPVDCKLRHTRFNRDILLFASVPNNVHYCPCAHTPSMLASDW